MEPILNVNKISKSFGGLTAVSNFSLALGEHDIQGVIGPNGAGKTTIFNLITGVYKPDTGEIRLDNKIISGKRPDLIAQSGIARTFQNIRLFSQMTVLDNIKMAYHQHIKYGFWDTVCNSETFRNEEDRIEKESIEYLDRFGLADRCFELAKNLPYGEQRRLEIARALATQPKVLLLDEPAAGMNPKEVEELIELIRKVHQDFALAILLIEHQMPVVMELCGHVQVVDFGQTIAAGAPLDVTSNPLVIRAYLGEEEAGA